MGIYTLKFTNLEKIVSVVQSVALELLGEKGVVWETLVT